MILKLLIGFLLLGLVVFIIIELPTEFKKTFKGRWWIDRWLQ